MIEKLICRKSRLSHLWSGKSLQQRGRNDVRSSYVFAANATTAVDWVKRYWRHTNDREIDLQKVQVITPMVGKIIATTWAQ